MKYRKLTGRTATTHKSHRYWVIGTQKRRALAARKKRKWTGLKYTKHQPKINRY